MREVLISNNDKYAVGTFVLNSAKKDFTPFKTGGNLFLTQLQDTGLKNEIIKIISEAQSVLKICSFILTDREIFDLILNRTKEGKIAVFVLTQLDPLKLANISFVTEEESKEQSHSIHLAYIKTLYDHGAHVRASTTAHAKFIITDRKVGFVMSANLTTPSLTYNTESGIYVGSTCVEKLDNLFDLIYQKGTAYKQYISIAGKNKQMIVQNESIIKPEWLPVIDSCSLRFTYEQYSHNLKTEIIRIINSANEFLLVSTYSIVALNNLSDIKEAIIQGIKKGIKVKVFCRGMNYRQDHLKACEEFATIGCEMFGDVYNHSKGILNEKEGLIFTANIDGNHGLINGFEIGSLLNGNQHAEMVRFHEHLIQTSPFVFKLSASRTELAEMYDQIEKSKSIIAPKFSESLILNVKSGLFFKKEDLEGHPIFYCRSKENSHEQFLVAGTAGFKVAYQDGIFNLMAIEKVSHNIDKYLLKYENLKIIYN